MTESFPSLGVVLDSLSKRLGRNFQINTLDLEIMPGEFFCLLGPSGSGKSTILGFVGGWITPDSGRVLIGGVDQTETPPHKRPARTCFQKGSFLFPHMTVAENIGYSLRIKNKPKQAVTKRVEELLSQVGLSGFAERRPNELSGGEAQRVAIARALADPQPILLLDEIQNGLDRHLQASTRQLLVDLTTTIRATTIYVTHDALEALSLASRLSSRICVLSGGKVAQVGSASELYNQPATPFVASFLGEINLLPASLIHSEQDSAVPRGNGASQVGIRPESVLLEETLCPSVSVRGEVQGIEFAGSDFKIYINMGPASITATTRRLPEGLLSGQITTAYLPLHKFIIFSD